MDKDEIRSLIPHRAPFLFLDEVLELTDTTIHARTFLSPELDLFEGHYPSFPVLPGVIQCEMCFQAAAVLIARNVPLAEGQIPVATRLNKTKFRRLVRPGETMDINVELTDRVRNAFFLTGRTTVEGETATRCDFACAAATV